VAASAVMEATALASRACKGLKAVLDRVMVHLTTDYLRYRVVKAEWNPEDREVVLEALRLFPNITTEPWVAAQS